MPYVSRRQQRYFHYAEGVGKIKPSVVDEFDKATNFKSLPERAGKKKRRRPRLAEYVT